MPATVTAARPHILYVGALFQGSTALHRMRALEDVGATVRPIDTYPPEAARRDASLPERIRRKLFGMRDLAGVNRAIRAALAEERFDALWIDKGIVIEPATLAEVRRRQPGCRIVGYSPDDMMNPVNQTRQFVACLPHYDVYFTTKSFGVVELQALGAPRAEFVGNAFDPEVHRPIDLSPDERAALGGPVGFIGQWEPDRAGDLCFLAESGIDVRVWGPSWERLERRPPRLRVEGRPMWHDDYARAICAFDINLCFLRKANRDLQTTRSVEIPACGAFMLAERTDEHLALFEEGREAEFFGDRDELLSKTRYYLEHPVERRRIAAAGRARCLASGYRNQDRALHMLDVVRAIRRGC